MKKVSFHVFLSITAFCLAGSLSAQQWLGVTNDVGAIYRSGNVGIGTTTAPTQKLRLSAGNMMLDYASSGTVGNIFFGGQTDLNQNGMRFFFLNSGSIGGFIDVRTAVATDGLRFRVDNNNGGTERMRINANGNIGMGTTAPGQRLHIHNGAIKLSGGVPGYGGPMVLFGSANADGSGVEQWGIEYIPTSNSPRPGLNFWKPFGSPNAGNYYLFLADNGNIGIGTDNPGSFKLAVEGKLGAREVKVTLTNPWPDYVFDPSYDLMSLDEIDAYLDEHKHLPGMPSADEVSKNNGIELGDMQVRQMEKIEELYLLLIDMNQKVKNLTAENEQLKQRLSTSGK